MKRFLIYSTQYGVYMGNNKWSQRDVIPANTAAPTYRNDDAVVRVIRDLPTDLNLSVREITPDKPGFTVSANKAADTGLPRWGDGPDGGIPPVPLRAQRGAHTPHHVAAAGHVAGTVKKIGREVKPAGGHGKKKAAPGKKHAADTKTETKAEKKTDKKD